MPIHGLIFDLDGTLTDTLPLCVAAFRQVFAHYAGRQYRDDAITALLSSLSVARPSVAEVRPEDGLPYCAVSE